MLRALYHSARRISKGKGVAEFQLPAAFCLASSYCSNERSPALAFTLLESQPGRLLISAQPSSKTSKHLPDIRPATYRSARLQGLDLSIHHNWNIRIFHSAYCQFLEPRLCSAHLINIGSGSSIPLFNSADFCNKPSHQSRNGPRNQSANGIPKPIFGRSNVSEGQYCLRIWRKIHFVLPCRISWSSESDQENSIILWSSKGHLTSSETAILALSTLVRISFGR